MLKTMIVGTCLLTAVGCSQAASTWTPVCQQKLLCPNGQPVAAMVGYDVPVAGTQDFTVRYYCGATEVVVNAAECPNVVRKAPDDSSTE